MPSNRMFAIVVTFLISLELPALETGKYAKVYTGGEGITVSVVPLKPTEENRSLIKIEGIEDNLDGLVLSYLKSTPYRNTDVYTTYFEGEERSFFQKPSSGSNEKSAKLWISGQRKPIILSYNRKKSKSTSPSELLAQHKSQIKDGSLKKNQSINLKKAKRTIRRAHRKYESEYCRTRFKLSIDWKSIQYNDYLYSDIGGRCLNVAKALDKVCHDIPGEKKVKDQIAEINCSFGNKEAVRRSGKILEVSMKRGHYRFPEKVIQFFE